MMHESIFRLHSHHLDETRALYLIRGKHFRPGLPRFVVFCTDGQMLTPLVSAVPTRVSERCLFVGIESNPETRDYDLIRGFYSDRYNSHTRFVVDEVFGHIDREYCIRDEKCSIGLCGFSNGATFAHALACQEPLIKFAIVLSAADNRVRRDEYSVPHAVRYYLAAGTREPGYLRATKSIVDDLTAVGAENVWVERDAEHNMKFWAKEFSFAMDWIVEA